MIGKLRISGALVAFAVFGGHFSLAANKDVPKWNQRMQSLSKTLSEMIPDVVGKTTPASTKRLEKSSQRLSELVHSLGVKPGGESLLPPDADPSMMFIKDSFESELQRSRQAIKNGNVDYGKAILRTTMQYCIACHSRTQSGPEFPTMTVNPNVEKLSPLEKAEIFAALRQFDGALAEYEKVMADSSMAKRRQIDWIRAVNQSLAISIRVKRDPNQARKLIERAELTKVANYYAKYLGLWKGAVDEWSKEKPLQSQGVESLLTEARRLFTMAQKRQQFPMDHSGDVYYLRASSVLHQLLGQRPDSKFSAEALYLLGRSYEVLGDPTLWPIHEQYYESCVHRSPHTFQAMECFHAFEESVYFGFSGSGGFALPDSVTAQIEALKKLALPEKQ